MNMNKKTSRNLIEKLKYALIYEEKSLIEFQYECFGKLPGYLNKEELERVRIILDTIIVQSLTHASMLSDLIIKFYKHERTAKNF